jgi:hypothetical protein
MNYYDYLCIHLFIFGACRWRWQRLWRTRRGGSWGPSRTSKRSSIVHQHICVTRCRTATHAARSHTAVRTAAWTDYYGQSAASHCVGVCSSSTMYACDGSCACPKTNIISLEIRRTSTCAHYTACLGSII